MTAFLYPGASQHPVPYPTPSLVEPLGLVLHVQQGNNSLAGYFANPNNGVLSHFWISKTGVVEQYKDGAHQSWAQMAGNATYHSVETEGFANEPLTTQQVSALADLYEWGHQTFGWALKLAEKPGDPGFAWHGMGGALWGGHTGCPGDLRKPQRADVLALLAPPTTGDDMPYLIRTPDGEIDLVLGAALIHLTAAELPAYSHLTQYPIGQDEGNRARAKFGV